MVLLDELEKAHSDVLNILLQIMEDGILTDGKGRTVNFKNAILVMTSNVGSRRILEVANKNRDSATTMPANNGAITTNAPSIDPLRPDEVMSRLTKNPEAMSMMMQAAADPELMGAMQTAMGGSPADLLRLGEQNPKVANFLKRLWSVLNSTEGEQSLSTGTGGGSNNFSNPPLERETDKNPSMDNDFAAGIFNTFKNMMNPSDEAKSTPMLEPEQPVVVSPPLAPNAEAQMALEYSEMSAVVKEELQNVMKPELLNRIDEIVIFSPLGSTELRSVAQLLLDKSVKRAKEERGIILKTTDALVNKVIEEGGLSAAQFGARPMRRAVQRFFEDAVSDAIIKGFITDGDEAILDIGGISQNGLVNARVTRTSDMRSIECEIEDGSGGIGAATSFDAPVNGSSEGMNSLQPDAIKG